MAAAVGTACGAILCELGGSAPSTSSPNGVPVASSVCHAWLWNFMNIAVHWSWRGNWKIRPPSCQGPLSWNHCFLPAGGAGLPWFMWMSWMPRPGRNPKY